MTSIEPWSAKSPAGFCAMTPNIFSVPIRRSGRCFFPSTLTLSQTTSPLFTPTPAGLPDTRLRSCAPSSFLLYSSTGPKQGPALLYGLHRSSPVLFPWHSSSAALPWMTCRLLVPTMTLWTVSGWGLGNTIPVLSSSLPAKMGKRSLALTASWQNPKPLPHYYQRHRQRHQGWTPCFRKP